MWRVTNCSYIPCGGSRYPRPLIILRPNVVLDPMYQVISPLVSASFSITGGIVNQGAILSASITSSSSQAVSQGANGGIELDEGTYVITYNMAGVAPTPLSISAILGGTLVPGSSVTQPVGNFNVSRSFTVTVPAGGGELTLVNTGSGYIETNSGTIEVR